MNSGSRASGGHISSRSVAALVTPALPESAIYPCKLFRPYALGTAHCVARGARNPMVDPKLVRLENRYPVAFYPPRARPRPGDPKGRLLFLFDRLLSQLTINPRRPGPDLRPGGAFPSWPPSIPARFLRPTPLVALSGVSGLASEQARAPAQDQASLLRDDRLHIGDRDQQRSPA